MTKGEQNTLFQSWLRDHLGLMIKVVRCSAASPHDREDLLQDILVNLWSSIPRFRGEAKESTWIYRVAFNTALAWRRGEHRRCQRQQELTTYLSTIKAMVKPDEADNHQLLIERLYEAIRQLPKLDASLAVMHLDGLGYAEMAEILGISETNVGTKLTRIRKQLADSMNGTSNDI